MAATTSTSEYGLRYAGRPSVASSDSTSLADLLERILDKGIVIAGDIAISLVDIELLTIKLRLLIASVDKAREMGVTWWESDPWLKGEPNQTGVGSGEGSSGDLDRRLARIESALERLGLAAGEAVEVDSAPAGDAGSQRPSGGRRR